MNQRCTREDIISQTLTLRQHQSVRSASSFYYEQPRMRLEFGQSCFSYAAPAAWSTLPPSLQQLTNTDTFKLQLKTLCHFLIIYFRQTLPRYVRLMTWVVRLSSSVVCRVSDCYVVAPYANTWSFR